MLNRSPIKAVTERVVLWESPKRVGERCEPTAITLIRRSLLSRVCEMLCILMRAVCPHVRGARIDGYVKMVVIAHLRPFPCEMGDFYFVNKDKEIYYGKGNLRKGPDLPQLC